MDQPPTAADLEKQKRVDEARYAKHMAKAREIASENGIEWSSVKGGLPPWIHMIREVCTVPAMPGSVRVPGGYAAGLWKIMSGLSHPSTSRSTRHSYLEPLSSSDSGVIHARQTASLRYTMEATTVAFNTVHEAIELLEVRRISLSR